MAKVGRPGVSYEEVAQAADSLIAQGKKATCEAVRLTVGRGSNSTIHPLWVQWSDAHRSAPALAPQVPNALLRSLEDELDRTAAAARAELEARLVEAQGNAKRLAEEGQALEAERDGLIEQMAGLQAERDQATTLATERATEIGRLNEAVAQSQLAAEAARLELAKGQVLAKANEDKVTDQADTIKNLNEEIALLRKHLDTAKTGLAEARAQVIAAREAKDEAAQREKDALGREREAVAKAESLRTEVDAVRSAAEKRLGEVQAAVLAREKDVEQKISDIEKTLIAERARAASAETAKALLEAQVEALQAKNNRAEARIDRAIETYGAFAAALKPPPANTEAEEPLLKPQTPPTPRKRSTAQQHDRQT